MSERVEIKDGWAVYTYKAGKTPRSVEFTPDVVAPTQAQAWSQHSCSRHPRVGFEYAVRYVVVDGLAFVLESPGVRLAGEPKESP